MRQILIAKFSSPIMAFMLFTTRDMELVNSNPCDKYWGVVNGEGENWLGRLLMEVREFWKARLLDAVVEEAKTAFDEMTGTGKKPTTH